MFIIIHFTFCLNFRKTKHFPKYKKIKITDAICNKRYKLHYASGVNKRNILI